MQMKMIFFGFALLMVFVRNDDDLFGSGLHNCLMIVFVRNEILGSRVNPFLISNKFREHVATWNVLCPLLFDQLLHLV